MSDATVIVESKGEMDPSSTEFQEMLAKAKGPAPESTKKEAGADPSESPSDKVVDTPDALRAKVDALTKELGRVREGKREHGEEAETLRERLANLEGQLKVMNDRDKETKKVGPESYSDDALIQLQADWEDALADARAVLRNNPDDAQAEAANTQVEKSKRQLNLIRKELHTRAGQASSKAAEAKAADDAAAKELTEMFDDMYGKFPELKEKGSDLWKAGQKEYASAPRLMEKLGPLGEIVAVARAIAKNPALVAKGDKETRKTLLNEIQSTAEKSLLKGSGSAETKGSPKYEDMPLDDFEKIVRMAKGG